MAVLARLFECTRGGNGHIYARTYVVYGVARKELERFENEDDDDDDDVDEDNTA